MSSEPPDPAGEPGSVEAPVVMLIYNRPELTARVFERVRGARPRRLFVVADGPARAADAERCARARAVVEAVDWECESVRDYAEDNMGCARRVASGLDAVFEQVDRAIVLEDDCVPEPSFFRFCDELLERHADDARIAAISGDNFLSGAPRTRYSYYFSRYNHVWGWASWRRAWRWFDFEMRTWPEVRAGGWLEDWLGDAASARYWTDRFDETVAGDNDSWAFRWTYACWINAGLTVLPSHNLVSNVGFGEAATHTFGAFRWAAHPTRPMEFPLSHPPFVMRDARADAWTQRELFRMPLGQRAKRAVKKVLGKP